MGLSSIMSVLPSLEAAMMIPHAAAAPLTALLFLAVHLYTLGLHLLGGELNLCSSVFLQLNSPAVVPTSTSEFVSVGGSSGEDVRIANAPGRCTGTWRSDISHLNWKSLGSGGNAQK